jgi:glycosyltransferase involved in cell wall biosynthesis
VDSTISAVVPTFNRASHVCRAVDSILRQSSPADEIIVVDDGSTDGTARLLRSRYQRRVQVIEQANGGVSSARRRGLQAASGDWIAFLDSDDEWLPGRLEAMARVAEGVDESVVCVFGDTLVRRDDGAETMLFAEHAFNASRPLKIYYDALPTQFPFMFSLLGSSLLRRDALLQTGAFLEGLRSSEDFLVSFRLALHHRFAVIPEAVTRVYRTRDLAESSLDRGQNQRGDYDRARMLAFREAWAARGGSWREHYQHAASRLTQGQLKDGSNAIGAALQQFRLGITPRAIAWTMAALASPLMPGRKNRAS